MDLPNPSAARSVEKVRGASIPLVSDTAHVLRLLWQHRRIIVATTRVELAKRFAGSSLGLIWLILQPLLLLSVYLFVYLLVFRVRLPEFGRFEYVLYVFSGLVPYIAVMEAVSAAPPLVKQNIHLVRNVLVPIELLAARVVLGALVSQAAGLAMVVALAVVTGHVTLHLAWLPIAIAVQGVALLGIVWIVSGLGVLVPDVSYVLNIVLLLLLYVSPIAFTPDMVPEGFRWVVALNPVTHLVEVFRASLMGSGLPRLGSALAFSGIATGFLLIGAAFFRRFKGALVDYE